MRTPAPAGLPSIQQHGLPASQPPLPSHSNMGRPPLDRAHTFPTPPASTSNVMGGMGHSENFGWQGQGMGGAQGNNPLPIDNGGLNTRSMPTTPATTPPGPGGVQNLSSYPPASQGYDSSRHMYSAPASHQPSPYPSNAQNSQDRMYSQAGAYPKQEMGPPSTRPSTTGGPGDHADTKPPNGIISNEPGPQQHHQGEEEGEHDAEYTHDSANYDAQRNSYNYTAPGVGALSSESNIPPEMTGSPSHPPGSGRATPRTTAPSQSYYNQNGGYNTPPRVQQSSSNLYNVMSNDRAPPNGVPSNDSYAPNAEMSGSMPNGYPSQQAPMHGSALSGKRSREEDEEASRSGSDMELKRRKTLESSVPAPAYDAMSRSTPAVSAPRRR